MKNKGDPKNLIPILAIIRFNIDFISEESNRIKTSSDVRNRVIEICTYISTEILSKLGDKDDEELEKQILHEFSKFDEIIKELESDDNEKDMLFLLTSHVGDMLHAVLKKNRKEVNDNTSNTYNETSGSVQTGMPKVSSLKKNKKEDFQLLLSLYKEHKTEENADVIALLKEVNPDATLHKCPYCEKVHDFTASRARKCPDCSEKMVVRQGLFVTEEQASELEKLIQNFYEKQGSISRVGYALEAAQDSKIHKQKVDYLRDLAEAFRYMAIVANQKDERGYSFWDKAWEYYNKARMEEMKSLSKDMMEYSQMPDISWNMTQMLLDQANSRTKSVQVVKDKRKALTHACMTLAEIAKFNAEPYFVTKLYEFAKKLMNELDVTDEELQSIASDVATRTHVTDGALKKYNDSVKELLSFEVIR